MQDIFLRRDLISNKGIIGVVTNDKGLHICETFEHPTLGIPYGRYKCARDNTGSHRFWKVLNVPGKKNVEWHVGNFITDTIGCILPGQSRTFMRNKKTNQIELSVASSGDTLKKIVEKKLFDDKFMLNIIS